MARLDQMSTVKQVAQLAAVVGRSFSLELLAAVSSLPIEALRDALERLVAAEVLYRVGRPGQDTYEFKHALLQDVAYQSLLKPARQRHHLRVARALEERFPATAQAHPELLAQHSRPADTPRSARPTSRPSRSCATAWRCWRRCPTRRSGCGRSTGCVWR
jgi:predicted ATPase